jgi:hypothetical protein
VVNKVCLWKKAWSKKASFNMPGKGWTDWIGSTSKNSELGKRRKRRKTKREKKKKKKKKKEICSSKTRVQPCRTW